MKTKNWQKILAVLISVSFVFLQIIPAGIAENAPVAQTDGTSVPVPVQTVADASSQPATTTQTVIPPNSLMPTGGISLAATTTPPIRVTTSAGLVSALNNATGGEVIVLAGGNYTSINFSNKQYSSYVTIRSEDPANRAIFDTINLTNVSYMRFQDVVIHHDRLATDTDYTRAFYVKNSSYIEVLDSEFYGSVDGIYNNDVRGFGTSFTNNVRFEGNTLHDLFYGGTFYDSDNLVVRDNTFKDLRCDGVAFQSASHVLVENNTFTSFHPVLTGTSPDHMDFIQFWNSSGTKDMVDIVIRGNTMFRGTGDGTQSIFIETKSTDGLYVGRDILIEYNTIYNDNMQGITVYDVASGLTVQYNTILADWAGDKTNYKTIPRLQIIRTTNAIVRYNILTYYDPQGAIGTVYQDNVVVQFTTGTNNNYAQLFSGAKNFGPAATLQDFIPLAGGPLIREGHDIGALDYQPTTVIPPPVIVLAEGPIVNSIPASTTGVVNISYSAIVGATGYQIQVARDPAFTDLAYNATVTNNPQSVSQLATGTYYVRVEALGTTGVISQWSISQSFSVSLPVISPFTGLKTTLSSSRYSGSSYNDKLTWTAISGATLYEIQQSSSSAFASFTSTFVTAQELKVYLAAKTTSYFRVRGWTALPAEGGIASSFSLVKSVTRRK